MSAIVVEVRGLPAPQGSHRHVGHGRMVESSKAVGPWREAVRAETQRAIEAGAQPITRGVAIDLLITFWLPRPKGHYGARGLRPSAPLCPAVRPDLDKITRSALDGLGAGGAWHDDAQVVSLRAEKCYADDEHPPGMRAWIGAAL